ncbi:MAG: molecular chaperone DnaJ [Synergistota bacterium]|nr:molecular chaperone DnaJ [Synergistota bacterium]
MSVFSGEGFDNGDASVVFLHKDFDELRGDVERLRTELSTLVLERDELLLVECRNNETAYMLSIGVLEYKAYEIECAVLRLKRKLELNQAKINRQEKVVLSEIEDHLDAAFAEYRERLKEQLEKMNNAIEQSQGTPLSDDEVHELKKLYRVIIKALHSDLHPDQSDAKSRLFQNAVLAYGNGDLDGLRIIEAMIAGESPLGETPDATELLMKEKDRLSDLVRKVKDRITEIKSEYPYTMKRIVQSPEMTEARKAELQERIERLRETLAAYGARVDKMLR